MKTRRLPHQGSAPWPQVHTTTSPSRPDLAALVAAATARHAALMSLDRNE